MVRGLLWVVGLVGLVGCNEIMPLEKPSVDAGNGGDGVAVLEAGSDAPAGTEAGVDAALPDSQQPDGWPWFDGGAAVCNTLWVPTDRIQVSESDSQEATQPSIAAIGNVFYVAYVEDGVVQVRRISPFAAGAKAGTAVPLSTKSGYPHEDPWITGAGGNHLAVTWTEPTDISATSCASDLMFRQLKDASGTLTPFPSSCKLSFTSTMGYPGSSIAYHQGTLGLAAPAEYNTTPAQFACGVHTKYVLHDFDLSGQCTDFGLTVNYSSGIPDTWSIVVAALPSGSDPFGVLRVRNDGNLYFRTRPSAGAWPAEQTLNPDDTALINVRPSLVDDGAGGVFMAYVKSDSSTNQPQIALRHQGTNIANTPLAGQANTGGFTEPFLARESQSGQTVVVVTRPGGSGGSAAVVVARLDLNTGGIAVGNRHDVSAGATKPRTPVVAAGERGFGVAWVEEVSGHDEVFFKWVGCRP